MEDRSTRFSTRRVQCGIVVAIALAGGFLALTGPALGHSGDAIDSLWAASAPTIDGAMSPGEWAGGASVDLGAIPGNRLSAFLLIMNNDTFLWLAYDAVGDRSMSSNDTASFALDTGHDGVATDGGEDQFVLSGGLPGGSIHVVFRGGGYTWEDMPFNTSLPNHAGLAGALGFGPSDRNATSHRIYEFQIPLALVRAGPGDTLGLFGGSQPAPGVVDYEAGFAYSTWPTYVTGPIPLPSYGDLNLAFLPGPIGVVLSPAAASANGAPGETLWYNLTARNTGTSVNDTFDVTIASTWSASLWAAGGIAPLSDTDADGIPDTGNLSSGGRAGMVVKVSIPTSATGCDVATVTARSSWNLSVSDSSSLTTCVGPAVFSPPHSDLGVDLDGNRRFDYLRVNASVLVSQADTYYVFGDLYSGNRSVLITNAYVSFFSTPGPYIARLDFDGRRIFSSGVDGPYLVELSLFDIRGQPLDSDAYTTGPYNATDFEAPLAAFRPPHSERGVDSDRPPNGLYDELWLNVSLVVGRAGTYVIDTYVVDSTGSFVTFTSNSSPLATGNQVATIVYPGDRFYNAFADGPYTIVLYLYDRFGNPLDSGVHVTGPYRRTDFDPPPITFAPPHSDRGVDTDIPPDGYYDWLVVSASVRIAEPGNYTVRGDLYGPGGFPYIATATTTRSLGVGPAIFDLRFPGPAIRRAQRSGNFAAYLAAGPAGGNATMVFDAHITGFYDFTQFQPPPGLLSPPHTDRGVDVSTPPDGLYDWLEVGVGIDVTRAGRFTVQGTLWGPRGIIAFATANADLALGRGSLPLRFDGHAIRLGGFDGPYFVDLSLHDAAGTEIDSGTHVTAAYPASSFQPPDASLPTSSASIAGGYWKNGPVRVTFDATDPSPSDGLASVALSYRYSVDNATWLAWTLFDTRAVAVEGLASFGGSFLFDLPVGDGYYQFHTVAADRAGGLEPAPASADVSAAAFVPARIDLTPLLDSLVAGSVRTFRARVLSAGAVPVVLESPLTVSLVTDSRGGQFRTVGTSSAVTSILVPAGASEGAFDYTDTAAGTATITAASPRTDLDSSLVTVAPGPVASIAVSPGVGGLGVGSSVTLTATARDAYGNLVPNPTFTWAVSGPGSLSGTSGTSVDLTATGAGFIRVTATSGTVTATATISGIATGGDPAAAGTLATGVGGGIALGLIAGVALGVLLGRRRKGREPEPSPPPQESPPRDSK